MSGRPVALLLTCGVVCCTWNARANETVFESGPTKVHLLELFTSEGCSSCPPAEAWLSRLKENPALWREFVPIAFHVDYWDHLGWRDRFSSKEWTARQQDHAARWNASSVYTPSFVLDGGESRAQLPPRATEAVGVLQLRLNGNIAHVAFKPANGVVRAYQVCVAPLGFSLSSDVAAGENRGRKLGHDFVVLSLSRGTLSPDKPGTELSILPPSPENIGAIAAWIEDQNSAKPVQAVGGWIKQETQSKR